VSDEPILALTSLSPWDTRVQLTRDCIASWRNAGLRVHAFNHPDEIPGLAQLYDVDFVPVKETAAPVFGRHLVPIKVMLDWAAEQDATVLLINSDIELRMADWEVRRVRWLADGGLCYFVRFNHSGDASRAHREPHGIDAFLLHGRDAVGFPDSFLSMGQPFWDFWLPRHFAGRSRRPYAVEFPIAFHQEHQHHWSWQSWHRCALEFARVTGESAGDGAIDACLAMSGRVRQGMDERKIPLPPRPPLIRQWVEQTFGYRGEKTFLELGAHQGTDTAWLAEIPDVTLHAFEPDPRNHQPPRRNVVVHRAAVADHDGRGRLILSQQGWGQEWTYSSSIKQPKNHLHRYPVSFGESVDVELVSLDTFHRQHGLDVVDFVWADVQGAEGEMVRGGRRALARTRYLYTEYSDDELYEQQAALAQIMALLPGFRIVELWPEDVLLENRQLRPIA
jgi:FkbM family methyltransferase